MYQPKVNNTQQYSDSQGEHIVCKGKLILLKNKKPPADVYVNNRGFHPIIISETEEIGAGDMAYGGLTNKNEIREIKNDYGGKRPIKAGDFNLYKILALPEHFSDKHLQAIVDGKMRDGEVLVNCVIKRTKGNNEYYININQQNHITLFPAKQTLGEASEEYYYNEIFQYLNAKDPSDTLEEMTVAELTTNILSAIRFGAEWAKKNNY